MSIQEWVPLASHTTFRIGGPARYFANVHDENDIRSTYEMAQREGLPVAILGGGSNTLIADEGYCGIVMHPAGTKTEWRDDGEEVEVIAQAGVPWDDLVAQSVARGLYGIENLTAIPGNVGGAIVQNIGCYGTEIREVVQWVEAFDPVEDRLIRFTKADCGFAYHTSRFKSPEGRRLIVLRASLRLKRSGTANLSYRDRVSLRDLAAAFDGRDSASITSAEVRTALIGIRTPKFPDLSREGTAGSYFLNPIVDRTVADELSERFPGLWRFDVGERNVKLATGWLLDHALGLRGFREGNVGTWGMQAAVLVNYGGASAREVRAFAAMIERRMRDELGVKIVPEVEYLAC